MMSLSNTIMLHAPAAGHAGDPAERERARLAFLSKYQAAVADRRKRAEWVRATIEPVEPDSLNIDVLATG